VSRPRARLILADDHHLLVDALRAMLAKSFNVVGVAHEGDALLALLKKTDADCLLLDLGMPGRNGLELLPDIRALKPALKVLVVTMHLDRSLADAALQAGAHGFMPKDSGLEELSTAIGEVLAGRRYLSPRVPPITNRMSLGAAHLGLAQLTPRQHEILRLIGDGKTTAEMAEALGLSARTVGFHRTNIRKALGVDSEAGLTRWAVLFRLGEGA
jgi:DNA-binding NarL/FixJ family response regulator